MSASRLESEIARAGKFSNEWRVRAQIAKRLHHPSAVTERHKRKLGAIGGVRPYDVRPEALDCRCRGE
jgi:hypothetical protein